ncbi:hypothetical protein PsorP6_001621 [Peronosclerospora sorghi]|uniref:Uncharacterized protein n=1 Tax=Peronosclerospora sorghi TaxID=230839 RepID=A0ACC0WTE6_9STRA|nr:hypothetical protein PsorP6_001621 [Peronosclerospora sorghi]
MPTYNNVLWVRPVRWLGVLYASKHLNFLVHRNDCGCTDEHGIVRFGIKARWSVHEHFKAAHLRTKKVA